MSVRTRIRIREGVSRGLCGTCQNAHITHDFDGKEVVMCHAIRAYTVTRPVAECSDHLSKNQMTDWEAKQIGWILESKNGRVIGFKAPSKKDDSNA